MNFWELTTTTSFLAIRSSGQVGRASQSRTSWMPQRTVFPATTFELRRELNSTSSSFHEKDAPLPSKSNEAFPPRSLAAFTSPVTTSGRNNATYFIRERKVLRSIPNPESSGSTLSGNYSPKGYLSRRGGSYLAQENPRCRIIPLFPSPSLVSRFRFQFTQQPSPCVGPMTLGRRNRNSHRFRRLFEFQSREKSKFNQLGLFR